MGLRHDALLRTDSALASLLTEEIARVEPDNPEVVLQNLHFGLRDLLDEDEEARDDWLAGLDEVVVEWASKHGAKVVDRITTTMAHVLDEIEEGT